MSGYEESDVRGWLLVLAPILGAIAIPLLENPWRYGAMLIVFILVLVLISLDATDRQIEGGHVILTLLIWPVGYLRYLHARSANFGPRKLIPGIVAVVLFLGANAVAAAATGEVKTTCKVVNGEDAECRLTNQGLTLRHHCFKLVLERPGGFPSGSRQCVYVLPGTTTKVLKEPWAAASWSPKKTCQEKLAKNGPDNKLVYYDDENLKHEIEEEGGVGYCRIAVRAP